MEAWDATAVPIALEPVTGDQESGATDLGAFGDGSFGVWTITEGVSEDVEVDEVSVTITEPIRKVYVVSSSIRGFPAAGAESPDRGRNGHLRR